MSLQAIGKHEEAAKHFESALALGADPAATLASVAVARLSSGQLTRAREAAQQALALDRALAPAYLVLGVEELGTGSPERALLYFQKSIAANPDFATARAYRGLAHLKMGEAGEAKAELLWALASAEGRVERQQIREYVDRIAESADQTGEP